MKALLESILNGHSATRDELLAASNSDPRVLAEAARTLREAFCGDVLDMCGIVNIKSGRCSEDCKWCAQSVHWGVNAPHHELIDEDAMVDAARACAQAGAVRFSLVASGRRSSPEELDRIARAIVRIRSEVGISVCASLGLLGEEDFIQLRDAGLTRVHDNLETSRRFWPQVCTTHSYDDKLASIRAARSAGLEVCSGCILGIGETMEDRIDMVLDLRELGVSSIPVNVLNPIPHTPLEGSEPLSFDEVMRSISVFRIAMPKAAIRLAGGRTLLPDAGAACFQAGANAVISGDMLTTSGFSFSSDKAMAQDLGFRIALLD